MTTADLHQVIARPGVCHCGSVHVHHVHHRDFPEIWAECTTPLEGAEHLVNLLLRACEASRGPWHRETIERAIADVRAYVEAGRHPKAVGKAAGRPAVEPKCIRTSDEPECPVALPDKKKPGHR